MAYQTYRFSLKSEEQRGASQPNIVRVALNSDADAATFGANLVHAFAANLRSVDTVLRSDYTLPYPVGTNINVRFVMRDTDDHVQTERLYDGASPFDAAGFAAAVIAGGAILLLPLGAGFGGAVASVQPAVFVPAQSY